MANNCKLPMLESIFQKPESLDRDAGVLRGVKILGPTSINGREYTSEAIAKAAPLYEGVRVNLDHPDRTTPKAARSIVEQWGWIENVQVREDGLYGDLHYIKTHPHTEPLLEMATRCPDRFGLSHNADCEGHKEGNRQIIDTIANVRSVDVVQRPATTSGLFEQEQADEPIEEPIMAKTMKKTFRQILESAAVGTKGKKGLLAYLEMDGMTALGTMPVDLPVDPASPDVTSSDDPIWDGVLAAINSVLCDDTLDPPTMKAQIGALLDHYIDAPDLSTATSDSAGTTTTAEEGCDPNKMESVDELRKEVAALKAENARTKAENKARTILEQHDIAATAGRVKGVMSVMEDNAELTDLLGSFPKRAAAQPEKQPAKPQKPQRATSLMEGEDASQYPKDSKAFMSAIGGRSVK